MTDFEKSLAEARERLCALSEDTYVRTALNKGFDVAANIAREVVAEKDAESAIHRRACREMTDLENHHG
jgi:prefoldin subunit 5